MLNADIFSNLSMDARSDLVLGILAGRPYSARKCPMYELVIAIKRHSYSSGAELEAEIREIIDRLTEDKYVKAINDNTFQITAKGVIFKKDGGGYTKLRRDKQRRKRLEDLSVIGTWLEALATLGLLLLELYKLCHVHLSCTACLTMALVAPNHKILNIPNCSIIYIMLSRINEGEGYWLFELRCGNKVTFIRIDELPCAETTRKLAA